MKFSIIIPVYNGADFIERALQSVLEQEGVELEVIVIDGASTDETVSIVRGYESQLAAIVSEKDQGQVDAINKGFARATGEIFGWLCHDDTLAPGALANAAALFEANADASIVTGASRRIYADGFEQVMSPRPDVLKRIGYHNGIEQPATFWKADLHRHTGELDLSYHHALDWQWWCRLKLGGASAVTTERIHANYYFPVDSKTSANPEANLEETFRIVRDYGPYEGALAMAYRFIYENYDLAGCFDKRSKASSKTKKAFALTMDALKRIFGEDYINSYNWQWISQQQRGKTWR